MTLKEELKNKIENNLRNSMEALIESFVTYYGEEYRSLIEDKIKNTEFMFYCNDKPVKPMFSKINIMSNNYTSLNIVYLKLVNEIKESNRKHTFLIGNKNVLAANANRIIYTNADIANFNSDEISRLNENIKENNTLQQSKVINGKYKQKIYIPIFFAGDKELIHEIIHSITRNIIGLSGEFTIDKIGLNTFKDESAIEEVVTDIEADKIYEIFKKSGKSIISEYFFYSKITSFYENFKSMIKVFYDNFKKETIYSRLTFNKNYLIEMIGKDNYSQLNAQLEEIYDHVSYTYDAYKEYTEEQKEEIIKNYKNNIYCIVVKMLENKKNEEKNPENIEAYLEYLEKLGYDVKRSEKTL